MLKRLISTSRIINFPRKTIRARLLERDTDVALKSNAREYDPLTVENEDENLETERRIKLEEMIKTFHGEVQLPLWQNKNKNLIDTVSQSWGDISVSEITNILDAFDAKQVKVLDVEGKCDFADTFIVAECDTEKQRIAIMDNLFDLIKHRVKTDKAFFPSLQGLNPPADWIICDLNRILVHMFSPEARKNYSIEELWEQRDGRKLSGKEELEIVKDNFGRWDQKKI